MSAFEDKRKGHYERCRHRTLRSAGPPTEDRRRHRRNLHRLLCTRDLESGRVASLDKPDDAGRPRRRADDRTDAARRTRGTGAGDETRFVHGTTVGINIDHRAARRWLLTNAGFEDVIELARLRMPETYSVPVLGARPDQADPPRLRCLAFSGCLTGPRRSPWTWRRVATAVAESAVARPLAVYRCRLPARLARRRSGGVPARRSPGSAP